MLIQDTSYYYSVSAVSLAVRTVLTKFAVTVHWQYSSIQFALAPRKKMCPTNELIQVNTNVSVPCVVVDLLDKEYRPLPRDGVGSTQGLPSITVQTGEWHTVLNRSVGNGTKKRWASTADAHNANPLREEDEKTM